MAASIVGWDLCSKSVTMFFGERIWNNFDWGKEKGEGGKLGADSTKRSLAKAIAWRIFAASNTLVGSFVLTKGVETPLVLTPGGGAVGRATFLTF